MIFNDILGLKILNFYDHSERKKKENTKYDRMHIAIHTLYNHNWMFFRKMTKILVTCLIVHG